MRTKRCLLKKKIATIGAVLLALPLLFGFTSKGGDENLNNKTPLNAQTSDQTVDKPFEDTKPLSEGHINSHEEVAPAAEKKTETPATPENSKPPENSTRISASDAEYLEYIKKFEGKTVVHIDFEGASSSTLPTVKSAVLMHEGDAFTSAGALRDINAIRNSGYFYEAYQTFSEIPEGVMITYHMLEHPVMKDVVIEGSNVYKEGEMEN